MASRVEVAHAKSRIARSSVIVYCGRPSALGNPFRMKTEAQRALVIVQFMKWFEVQLQTDTPARRMYRRILYKLQRGQNVVLTCWCHPKPCHTEIIRDRLMRDLNLGRKRK